MLLPDMHADIELEWKTMEARMACVSRKHRYKCCVPICKMCMHNFEISCTVCKFLALTPTLAVTLILILTLAKSCMHILQNVHAQFWNHVHSLQISGPNTNPSRDPNPNPNLSQIVHAHFADWNSDSQGVWKISKMVTVTVTQKYQPIYYDAMHTASLPVSADSAYISTAWCGTVQQWVHINITGTVCQSTFCCCMHAVSVCWTTCVCLSVCLFVCLWVYIRRRQAVID